MEDRDPERPDDQPGTGPSVAARAAVDDGDVVRQAGEDAGERRGPAGTRSQARQSDGQPAGPDTSRLPPADDRQGPDEQGAPTSDEEPAAPPGIARATNGVWMVRTARVTTRDRERRTEERPGQRRGGLSVGAGQRRWDRIGRSVGPAASRGP